MWHKSLIIYCGIIYWVSIIRKYNECFNLHINWVSVIKLYLIHIIDYQLSIESWSHLASYLPCWAQCYLESYKQLEHADDKGQFVKEERFKQTHGFHILKNDGLEGRPDDKKTRIRYHYHYYVAVLYV